jgi:hypothetical protein
MKANAKKYTKPATVSANYNPSTHAVPALAMVAGYAVGRAVTNAIRVDSLTKANGLTPVIHVA